MAALILVILSLTYAAEDPADVAIIDITALAIECLRGRPIATNIGVMIDAPPRPVRLPKNPENNATIKTENIFIRSKNIHLGLWIF